MLKATPQLFEQSAPAALAEAQIRGAIHQDMARAFRLDRIGPVGAWLSGLLIPSVDRLTRDVLDYDARVGRDGLAAGSRWLVEQFSAGLTICGAERIPQQGPLLLASNHPGLVDALAIFAALGRDDLRVVAAERPVLHLLPHIDRHILYVPESPSQRLGVVRGIAAQLRAGGAVLTFPGGQIEPDPARFDDAAARLADWSDSLALFARMVPEVQVLPVMVSGVLSPGALGSPLARLHRARKDREWAAASLQLLQRRRADVHVRVNFGQPIHAATWADAPDAAPLMAQVTGQMRALMQPPL